MPSQCTRTEPRNYGQSGAVSQPCGRLSRQSKTDHSDCLMLKRRSSIDYDEDGKAWRDSVIDLSKWASQGDESVLTDVSNDHLNAASLSGADMSGSAVPQEMEDPQIQVRTSACPSTAGSLDDSTMNLCHRCAGITVESLSSQFGYEHGLLSERPSRDQLYYLRDWANSAFTGLCKLCLVLMDAYCSEDLAWLDQDRHRLLISREGLKKEEIHDQDHFDAFRVVSGQKVRKKGRSMAELVIRIVNLDILEQLENYTGPQGEFTCGLFRHRRRLHCFTDVGDPSVPFGVSPVRQVGKCTSSAASFEVAAAWLSQCLAADPPEATGLSLSLDGVEHSEWSKDEFKLGFDNVQGSAEISYSSGPGRPTRLIDINSGPESDTVRLTENNKNEVLPYATLSYCWGGRPQTRRCEWLTTMINVHSRGAGLQRSDLPKTLQDSIIIAEQLGIRYLWIDSLCIIQDSDDDWATEAAKMGEIYLGSVVTIVAASSSSAEHGCFNQRSVPTIQSLRAHDKVISIQTSFSDGRTSNLHIITQEQTLARYGYGARGEGLELEDLYECQVNNGP